MTETIRTIENMAELLYRLHTSPLSSKKYRASIHTSASQLPYIREVFTEVAGSAPSTYGFFFVKQELFDEALHAQYISGIVMPGHVSEVDFRITALGEQKFHELRREIQKEKGVFFFKR